MINKYLIASEYGFNGIYRAKLITAVDESDIRVYIPGINNVNPFDSDGNVDLKIYEKNKLSYPVVQWCCYNLESKELVNIKGPAWVMFENGDVQRPVCISYSVIGGEGETNAGSVTNTSVNYNTSSGGSGSNIVENAKKYLGVPYVYGGATPAGFDCSGLTQYVYNESGITIPRVAADQYKSNSGQFVDKSQLQPGDLVFFTGSNGSKSNPGHVGIYVGNNQMIHAPSTGKTVRYQDISTSYYVNSYVGAKRYN